MKICNCSIAISYSKDNKLLSILKNLTKKIYKYQQEHNMSKISKLKNYIFLVLIFPIPLNVSFNIVNKIQLISVIPFLYNKKQSESQKF